jgi:uncharacterized OB-fold protein
MTIEVREVEWTRPLPAPDGVSAEFWSALVSGRLLIQSCAECGHRQFYPRAICVSCGSEPVWTDASGRGTVHTFTVVRQNGLPAFRDAIPYVTAIIELEEGPRLMGNVTGCAAEDVRIGMAVRAYALKATPDIGIPMWEAASE